jgi:hypothetical protein
MNRSASGVSTLRQGGLQTSSPALFAGQMRRDGAKQGCLAYPLAMRLCSASDRRAQVEFKKSALEPGACVASRLITCDAMSYQVKGTWLVTATFSRGPRRRFRAWASCHYS